MVDNLDVYLNKITNENCEINCRAMENLHLKIQNKIIDLTQINEKTAEKFLFCFSKWFSIYLTYQAHFPRDENFIIKTLELFKKSVDCFPPAAIQNLKNQIKISNIINDIGEILPVFRNISDQILKSLSKSAIENDATLNNSNLVKSGSQNLKTSTNKNIPTETAPLETSGNNISFNYSESKHGDLYNNTNKNSNLQSQFASTSRMKNQQTAGPTQNNQSFGQPQPPRQPTHESEKMPQPLQQELPTFKKVVIPQQEEQFIFDLGINLKFGDEIQFYKVFNILYSQTLNDYPIEYILQCEELVMAFFNILETREFLKYGVKSAQILDKLLNQVNDRINFYSSDADSLKLQRRKFIQVDPTSVRSIENFLLYSLSSLTSAIIDVNKMSFYIKLINKNFTLVQNLMINAENWNDILYKILSDFDTVVSHYRSKNFNAILFFNFLLDIYINMNDEMILDLIENDNHEVEPLVFIKNLFFIVNESEKTQELIKKFTNIKGESREIENFLIDYNNASLIYSSIEITKKMLSGETDTETIIENFYNILLSLKFLNNNSEEDFNSIFPNNSSPLIGAICDYFDMDNEGNKQKCIDLLVKLLSFKSSEKIDSTLSIYNSILNEIKTKRKKILPLFMTRSILTLIVNDLVEEKFQDILLEILFELFNQEEVYSEDVKDIFMLIPPFQNNFKFTSLQNKMDSSLKYENIMLKYIRFLFSKSELVRFTAINFLSLNSDRLQNSNNSYNFSLSESNLKKNYAKFKSTDTLLLIQTVSTEFSKIIKNSDTVKSIEFLPLLNILYSTKMDYNMKTSALEQLVLSIKNENYKDYYLNDVLNFILKEVNSNMDNMVQSNMQNYFVGLLKLLDSIMFFYMAEPKISSFFNFMASKETVLNMITIALQKENTKHLLSAYALLFLYFVSFYYKDVENENFYEFPILSFFEKFYYVNLVPTNQINITNKIAMSSVLSFSITKNVIDYVYFKRNPLLKIYNFEMIKGNIRNFKNLKPLDIFVSITHLLSFASVYPEYDISECLVQIMFFFKKILPTSSVIKNLLMDYFSIFDMYFYQNFTCESYDEIMVPFITELIANLLNYISINKDFIQNLKAEDNINLVFEVVDFLIRNRKYYPKGKDEVMNKFIETYSNVFVFNQEENYYKLKIILMKFISIFSQESLFNPTAKTQSDIINTISFFLTKYEPNVSYINMNYVIWALNYLAHLIKKKKGVEVIKSKSFIFIKFLQSPYDEIKILSITILQMLLSPDIFEKHGTILTDVYTEAKSTSSSIVKSNYFNFLGKCIEFILSNKAIGEEANDVYSDVMAMNERIFDEGEVVGLISSILEENSINSSLMLKYVSLCLNANLENEEYIKGIFFNFAFYDHMNDMINQEKKKLEVIANTDLLMNPILNISKDLNTDMQVTNRDLKDKIMRSSAVESVLFVKEILNLLIRSFTYLKEEAYVTYQSNLSEIFLNLVSYNEIVCIIWTKWIQQANSTHIKVLQSYALKYFSYLQFVFDAKMTLEAIGMKLQELNNVCYDMVKFESENEFMNPLRIMYAKVLPFLIQINSESNSGARLKNEGDALLILMTAFKVIYDIKIDMYNTKFKCVFELQPNETKTKNDITNSIMSLLMVSQSCKRIFVKSNFYHTFLDYIVQLNDYLLASNMEKLSDPKAASASNKASNEKLTLSSSSRKQMHNNGHNPQTDYVISEYSIMLITFQNLFYNFDPCEEKDSLFIYVKNSKINSNRFLNMLYNTFFDVYRYVPLFDNYLKLLINIVSNNEGELCKYFLTIIEGGKENLLNLVLDHFSRNVYALLSHPNFDMYILFLKCLLQFRLMSLTLLKTKFSENVKIQIIKLIHNYKTFSSQGKNMFIIKELMEIFISLSFDLEHAKKLASKEFIIALSEILVKSKMEDLIYNVLFFYRNICFVNSVKVLFMNDGNLMGIIFAIFTGEFGIKVKYMISHVLWVLLFNNQTLKTMLNREEFKSELKTMNIHFQKELDLEKFGEETKDNEAACKNRKYLEETCLNMKKIMHIVEQNF